MEKISLQRTLLLTVLLGLAAGLHAQTDSAAKHPATDTIVIGNMIIVRSGKQEPYVQRNRDTSNRYYRRHGYYKPPAVSTNWLIFDIGFANFSDKTDYGSASAQQFAPGATRDWFQLRTVKSVDVNIWLFMQKYNLVKHVLNLKYGVGIELNNYRYLEDIKYLKDPTTIIMDTLHHNKNKLAVDYFTVPLMLNFNFTPHKKEGFALSVGMSAGYRYSSRQKFKGGDAGKSKTYGDFDLEPWKFSYITELQMGPIRLYGSLATKSMFKKGLDQTPYTLGLRFSNW